MTKTTNYPAKRYPVKRMDRKTFSLPIALIREIERVAEVDYGSNDSALVTQILCEALDVPMPEERAEAA